MSGLIVLIVVILCFGSIFITAGDVIMFGFLLVIAIAVAIALLCRNCALNKTVSKVPEDQLHVLNLDKGGIFRLTGVGNNSEEINLKVIAKHLYRQGDYYWYELECDKGGGEKIWVEVEDDDETEVSIVLEKLTLADIGMTSNRLTLIDDEETGVVSYRGLSYKYTDSDEAVFYRFCDDAKAEKLYYWDFENGKYSVSVERWGNRDYDVFYSQKMLPSQITVYLNKEKGV